MSRNYDYPTTPGDTMSIAKWAADRYHKATDLPRQDLRNEALMVVLAAESRFDPSRGIPKSFYLWRVAVLHLRAYAIRQKSPVSSSNSYLAGLRSVKCGSLDAPNSAVTKTANNIALLEDQPEDKAFTNEVRAIVRKALAAAKVTVKNAALAERVLLGGEEPMAVAKAAGITRRQVYAAVDAVKKYVREDVAAYTAWRYL